MRKEASMYVGPALIGPGFVLGIFPCGDERKDSSEFMFDGRKYSPGGVSISRRLKLKGSGLRQSVWCSALWIPCRGAAGSAP